MKKLIILSAGLFAGLAAFFLPTTADIESGHCVFRTLFGEDPVPEYPKNVIADIAVENPTTAALQWLAKAQQRNGAWGCGSHSRQNVMNPHAVDTDPATTAMVGMALLRSGSTLNEGPYQSSVREATDYLLQCVEEKPQNASTITDLRGTQIQSKLGANIDVVLTTQFFTNLLEKVEANSQIEKRLRSALDTCLQLMQQAQDEQGRVKNAGWAGVLQSSFATNAMESARKVGAYIDGVAITKAKDYQKSNFNAKNGDVKTTDGAGVLLYAVSGSVRASAQEAREAEEAVVSAYKSGKIKGDAEVSVKNLTKAGIDESKAMKLKTSYDIFHAARERAVQREVIDGFGSDGGEEYLSFLQTGESLVMYGDDSWKNWYSGISKRLIQTQNQDGSWNGHHCITSPVFCTATCILILSIENDIEQLHALGQTVKE